MLCSRANRVLTVVVVKICVLVLHVFMAPLSSTWISNQSVNSVIFLVVCCNKVFVKQSSVYFVWKGSSLHLYNVWCYHCKSDIDNGVSNLDILYLKHCNLRLYLWKQHMKRFARNSQIQKGWVYGDMLTGMQWNSATYHKMFCTYNYLEW